MTLSYTTGLALGSIVAYMLDDCLGPVASVREVCENIARRNDPITTISNASLEGAMTLANHTVKAAVTRLPKFVETTNVTATLATLLATSMMVTANDTLSVFHSGLLNVTSTALPKIVAANASSTIGNSILQQR